MIINPGAWKGFDHFNTAKLTGDEQERVNDLGRKLAALLPHDVVNELMHASMDRLKFWFDQGHSRDEDDALEATYLGFEIAQAASYFHDVKGVKPE